MGVSGLYPALKARYKRILLNKYPENVSSLAIDMNSLIHPVLQLVYSYGDGKSESRSQFIKGISKDELFEQFFQVFSTFLINLISRTRPTDMLIFAVDGVPPEAKIAQQRQRRFLEGSIKEEDEEEEYKEEDRTKFDGNSVSPGTDFMIKLNKRIDKWIQANNNSEGIQFPPRIIYSNHLVPGEGEHKILEIYRNPENLKFDKKLNGSEKVMTGAHLVYGNDADLLLLLMLLPINNIVNIRPMNFDERENAMWVRTEIVDIKSLRIGIEKDLKNGEFQDNGIKNNAVNDFVAMMSLLGNDFMPGIFAFRDIKSAIKVMVFTYLQVGKPLTMLGDDCTYKDFNWNTLNEILSNIGFRDPLEENQTTYEEELLNILVNSKFVHESEILNNSKIPSDDEYKVVYNTFRTYWYQNSLQSKNRENDNRFRKIMKTDISGEDITDMCIDYLTTMAWVYRYYQGADKSINKHWVYRRFYAPLMSDLSDVAYELSGTEQLKIYKPIENSYWISPAHLLLAILPPKSMSLIPRELRKFVYDKNSPIFYLYPRQFRIEYEGFFRDHQNTPIIPFVNMEDIIGTVANISKFENASLLIDSRNEHEEHLRLERTLDPSEIREHNIKKSIIYDAKNMESQYYQEINSCKFKTKKEIILSRESKLSKLSRGAKIKMSEIRTNNRQVVTVQVKPQIPLNKNIKKNEEPKKKRKGYITILGKEKTKYIVKNCNWNETLIF